MKMGFKTDMMIFLIVITQALCFISGYHLVYGQISQSVDPQNPEYEEINLNFS